ncbi:glycosyltransferase family 2 protein [Opitutus sp. GAS368]|jgi:GT2 family glycosyltransferase|uniref:glycosyltransferase family 2 protein n=1 Tax=Opitutus sp. GAS368 TaxID=1882749 RepID=UPI00087DDAFF|nr:glycosyltransferase family 2 protein [Opitutus sp. GAS368]SDS63805.1 Glycosyl transferase family 2 [Opitutus sp. GAS368]
MSRPTLALCIPAYNATGFLGRLLAGARAQTIPFDEIWVYDDASTDGTAALAEKLGARVVRGEKNAGCSHGKNAVAARCTSTWLHFHDADDALEPNFVATARRWMERPDAPDVVLFNYRTLEDGTERPLGIREFDGAALRADALAYCLAEQINPFCGLYRREPFLAAGGWDEDYQVLQSEDQAGHLRLALAGLRFDADPTYTVINYIRAGSMTTSNLAGAQRSTYHVLAKGAAAAPARYLPIIARRLWITAGFSGAYNDWENADRAAALARRIAPALPPVGGPLMRFGARHFPRLTLRLREKLIRLFRPSARAEPVYQRAPKIRPGT